MRPDNLAATILGGVVGSQAYNLATPTSDIDRMGVFAYPTMSMLGLQELPPSIVKHTPDVTLHEARKFCKLALKCNPTVSELLWLDDYEVITPAGATLVHIRRAFLSEKYVRSAYLGYATSQLKRLRDRDFRRGAKHARHLLRLIDHAVQLFTTGELHLKVTDPQWYFETAEDIVRDPMLGQSHLLRAEMAIDEAAGRGMLPREPDIAKVEQWLLDVRKVYM